MSGIWAAVPVKGLGDPKSRLSTLLSKDERIKLTLAMMRDVLSALLGARGLAGVLAISPDRTVLDAACVAGADAECETTPAGYNHAVAQAARRLAGEGAGGVMVIPGDVPLVNTALVGELLARHGAAPSVTIVPARDGDGTNALILSPPGLMAPAFGPGSFARHAGNARALGIEPTVLERPDLGLDIDTADDLGVLLQRGSETNAQETMRFLAEAGIEDRLNGRQ
jgi:2-phospho-L-lactate guanylyltransferase